MTLRTSDSRSAQLLSVLYSKLDPIKIADSKLVPNNELSGEIENVVDYLLERCPHWSSAEKSNAKELVMNRIASLGRTAMAQEILELAPVQNLPFGRRVATGIAFCLVWIVIIVATPIALTLRVVTCLCSGKRFFDPHDFSGRGELISEGIESLAEKIWPLQPACYCCEFSSGKRLELVASAAD